MVIEGDPKNNVPYGITPPPTIEQRMAATMEKINVILQQDGFALVGIIEPVTAPGEYVTQRAVITLRPTRP